MECLTWFLDLFLFLFLQGCAKAMIYVIKIALRMTKSGKETHFYNGT